FGAQTNVHRVLRAQRAVDFRDVWLRLRTDDAVVDAISGGGQRLRRVWLFQFLSTRVVSCPPSRYGRGLLLQRGTHPYLGFSVCCGLGGALRAESASRRERGGVGSGNWCVARTYRNRLRNKVRGIIQGYSRFQAHPHLRRISGDLKQLLLIWPTCPEAAFVRLSGAVRSTPFRGCMGHPMFFLDAENDDSRFGPAVTRHTYS